jgi:RNA polymerase sigma factor (sigma-70 family)
MAFPVEALEDDRKLLWGLCYRMTGNAADADDLVQETFLRTLNRPPRDTSKSLRPWLIRVAMNLSRDLLRRRKRRDYRGPWLPSPVSTDEESPASYEPPAASEDSPVARYDLKESISFAFLLALEELTPLQRAVLLLRDVFDYSTAETADALDISGANVKVVLHRARHRMKNYDGRRVVPDPARRRATEQALDQFLKCLSSRDAAGLERLLTEDVVSLSDGGGEVYAALQPIRGRNKVVRLVFGLAEKLPGQPQVTLLEVNGVPGLLMEYTPLGPGYASRFIVHCEVDEAGRIRALHAVVAPKKLTAIEQHPSARQPLLKGAGLR